MNRDCEQVVRRLLNNVASGAVRRAEPGIAWIHDDPADLMDMLTLSVMTEAQWVTWEPITWEEEADHSPTWLAQLTWLGRDILATHGTDLTDPAQWREFMRGFYTVRLEDLTEEVTRG